jgi:hypothetical protein
MAVAAGDNAEIETMGPVEENDDGAVALLDRWAAWQIRLGRHVEIVEFHLSVGTPHALFSLVAWAEWADTWEKNNENGDGRR